MAVFSDGGSQQSSTVTKLTVTEQSYSSSDNSSVVAWKLTMSVATYNFSGWDVLSKVWLDDSLIYNKTKESVSIGKNSTITLASGTKTIKHDDNGKKTISCKAETSTSTSASYLPGKATPEGELKLTDISRNAKFDPVEQAKTLKIEKYNDNYYNKLLVYVGNTLVATRLNIDIDYSFQFTQGELTNNVYPNITSNIGIINFMLYTYTDSSMEEQIGDYSGLWYRGTIVNADPTFNDFEYEDSNSITTALTNDSNKIIPKYSTLKVTIPVEDKATGKKGATITGYTIDNYSVAYSDSEDVIKQISNYPNESIVVSAVDSRGNSKSITKLFTDNFINYTDLVILNCEVNREDEIGEKVKIKFNGTWWQANFGGANGGGVLNELTAAYQYQTGTGEFINGTTPLTLDTSEFGKFSCEQYIVGDTGNGFNISNSYNIKLIISDKLSSKSKTKELIAGEPAIAIFGNKVAFHGKYDESRIDIPNQFYGKATVDNQLLNKQIGDIVITSTNENPASRLGGTWELIGKDFNDLSGNFVDWVDTTSNCTVSSLFLVRSKNNFKIRMSFVNEVALADSTIELGTLNYTNMGVDNIGITYYGLLGVSDGGNGVAQMTLDYATGKMTSVDVIVKGGGTSIAAGNTFHLLLDISVKGDYMLDEACDKFYWKKVS